MSLTIIILTLNEELHIQRAIESAEGVATKTIIVDSGSSDSTVELAHSVGAEVFTHPFETQAKQFNWALEHLPIDTDWIFRLDADEIISPELAYSLKNDLPNFDLNIAGCEVLRRMTFLGRTIRYGGLFPVPIVRLLRYTRGHSEDRWMDEHIVVDGEIVTLDGELLDDNKNNLTWWTEKHNKYASREVIEILDTEFNLFNRNPIGLSQGANSSKKRWIKDAIYARFPGGMRALGYFVYRYIFRLGFLDGKEGAAFHVLQGFWYRYLVDMKLLEVRKHMQLKNTCAKTAIYQVLGIDIGKYVYPAQH